MRSRPKRALAPRCIKELREKQLAHRRHQLPTSLSHTYRHPTTLSLQREGRDTPRAPPHPRSRPPTKNKTPPPPPPSETGALHTEISGREPRRNDALPGGRPPAAENLFQPAGPPPSPRPTRSPPPPAPRNASQTNIQPRRTRALRRPPAQERPPPTIIFPPPPPQGESRKKSNNPLNR